MKKKSNNYLYSFTTVGSVNHSVPLMRWKGKVTASNAQKARDKVDNRFLGTHINATKVKNLGKYNGKRMAEPFDCDIVKRRK